MLLCIWTVPVSTVLALFIAVALNSVKLHDPASFVMTDGEIYDNGNNALFLLNNSVSITDGEITDTFAYGGGLGFTWGEAEVTSVAFDLFTNHNTAYHAESFNGIQFSVNEGDKHFANFKPASGYTYTAGDEAKFVSRHKSAAAEMQQRFCALRTDNPAA